MLDTETPPLKRSDSRHSLDHKLEKALSETDREFFVHDEQHGLVIGRSIPTEQTLRQILSVLKLPPTPKILQVGAGSGYISAVLSRVARQVIALEKEAWLAQAAMVKIQRLNLLNIDIRQGEGEKGAPRDAPFEVIVVSTPNIADKSELLRQLAPHGQLICVERVEPSLQMLVKYTEDGHGNHIRREYDHVDFVENREEIFIELGLVTDDILREARQRAIANKTLIIDEVRRLKNLDDIKLYRSLAKKYDLPLSNADDLLKRIDPGVFNRFSKAFLDHEHLIPLYMENNTLKVGTNNPDASIAEVQKVFRHHKIEKVLVTPTDFRRIWSAIDLSQQNRSNTEHSILDTSDSLNETDLDKYRPEMEARLVSIFEALLLDAIAGRASDIHLEQYHGEVRVRLRIDGELQDIWHYDLNPAELKGLINVIKLRADLNIAERRLPQGGRSRLRVGGALYDLRVQVQPSLHGEHVVIRLLPQNSELIGIENLGLSHALAEDYKRLLRNPAGLVLVVGPTGSGKSTTLYAGVQLLATDGTRKVITVEDPIEYSIDNIQQTRVRPEIGFNFADAMRSFVRQDPDVILVGEIRDQETALEAIRASQTGHVVLSTLHCNDAVDAMQRLFDLNVHPNSLASELLAVIAQRLAKRICPNCRTETEPDVAIVREMFPQGTPNDFKAYVGKGCEQCGNAGTLGRVAVVEYLQLNPELRNAISRQLPIGELRKLALDNGLITMRDSALDHVIQGNIPLTELPRILPAERMAPEARWQWGKTS